MFLPENEKILLKIRERFNHCLSIELVMKRIERWQIVVVNDEGWCAFDGRLMTIYRRKTMHEQTRDFYA